jgi:Bax protein
MIKLIKVIVLIILVGIAYVLVNEHTSYDYLYPAYHINYDEIPIKETKSIIIQDYSTLLPIKYKGTIDFDTIPEEQRRQLFINYMLPSIVIERDRLFSLLQRIDFIENRMINKKAIRAEDLLFFKEMMQLYDANSIKDLKVRLYPHPVSLVLAQAILESGWGTSSVFSKANNPFGIMSFSADEQRRKFTNTDQSEVYVRSYNDVCQAVEHYYHFTAKLASYEKFRKKRWERGSTASLVKLMKSYHETAGYTDLVESIIKTNELDKYDNIVINKEYFSYRKDYFQLIRSYIIDYF